MVKVLLILLESQVSSNECVNDKGDIWLLSCLNLALLRKFIRLSSLNNNKINHLQYNYRQLCALGFKYPCNVTLFAILIFLNLNIIK